MKAAITAKLEELLNQPAGEVANDMRTLQKEYQKLWTTEFETAKQSFIDEGGKAKEFIYEKHPDDVKIGELFEKYNKLKKEEEQKIVQEQNKNLLFRQDIISKIKDLTQVSDNVGAAVRKLKELQQSWKDAGAVSPHKYKEIQGEYSRASEEFYYNLKIFKELQEHDLKKNCELKLELLEKIKTLQGTENIKEVERVIKVYRNDWDEIGPVPNEKWEQTKHDYKNALDEIYSKIKKHYGIIEEKKENNLQSKKSLIEKAIAIAGAMEGSDVNKWNDATNKLIEIQNDWKLVGRTTQKDNDVVWNEFRTICDGFFERKKAFFCVIHEKQGDLKKIKISFIEKAEKLQASTDWQKTSQDLMRLQDDWKKQHLINDKEEGKLFFKFRKACNSFFDAKKAHFDSVSASFESNVGVKEEILNKLISFVITDNIKESLSEIKKISLEWNAAGQVPYKDKKRLNDAFYNRLDELYEKLNLDKSEKTLLQFRSKIERMAMAENASELLRREADYLKKQMDDISNGIKTYDNNMGFFKHAKPDNPLLKEVLQKIDTEKQKLSDFSAKRKLVAEELNKVKVEPHKRDTVTS